MNLKGVIISDMNQRPETSYEILEEAKVVSTESRLAFVRVWVGLGLTAKGPEGSIKTGLTLDLSSTSLCCNPFTCGF